jgi:hypothetical protein
VASYTLVVYAAGFAEDCSVVRTDLQLLQFLKVTLLKKRQEEVEVVCEKYHHLSGLSLDELQMCPQQADSYQYL